MKFIKENLVSFSLLFIIIFSLSIYLLLNSKKNNEESSVYDIATVDYFVTPPNETDHYKYKNENNKITLVNYFSIDCPHCRKLDNDSLKFQEYFKTKFNLVYRHKPLKSQPLSYEKAQMAECVFKQSGDTGMFGFINYAYSNFDEKSTNNEWLKKYAYQFAQDKQSFDLCMQDENEKQKILLMEKKTIASNIYSTPTIVVFENGVEIARYNNLSASVGMLLMQKYAK